MPLRDLSIRTCATVVLRGVTDPAHTIPEGRVARQEILALRKRVFAMVVSGSTQIRTHFQKPESVKINATRCVPFLSGPGNFSTKEGSHIV